MPRAEFCAPDGGGVEHFGISYGPFLTQGEKVRMYVGRALYGIPALSVLFFAHSISATHGLSASFQVVAISCLVLGLFHRWGLLLSRPDLQPSHRIIVWYFFLFGSFLSLLGLVSFPRHALLVLLNQILPMSLYFLSLLTYLLVTALSLVIYRSDPILDLFPSLLTALSLAYSLAYTLDYPSKRYFKGLILKLDVAYLVIVSMILATVAYYLLAENLELQAVSRAREIIGGWEKRLPGQLGLL